MLWSGARILCFAALSMKIVSGSSKGLSDSGEGDSAGGTVFILIV